MTKTGQQFAALLRKNWIVYKRNVGSTVISFLVPIIFIALLYLMQFAVQENQSRNSNIKLIRETSPEEVTKIPACVAGPSGLCYTIGYSPSSDPNVKALMDLIMQDNNLPSSSLIGFETEAAANLFLQNNPNTTQGLFHVILDYNCSYSLLGVPMVTPAEAETCYSRPSKAISEVVGLKYSIQYNTTGFSVRGVAVNINTYLLLPMQQAFDRAAFALFGSMNPDNYQISVSDFAHPEIAPTNIIATAGQYVFFGALMFNFVIQIGQLVTEKQLKLRESMRVMGLQDWVYWVSWFVTNILTNIVTIILLVATGCAFQFDFFLKNDFLTYALLFLLFAFAMVPLAFWIASLVDDTDTATLAGFGIFLLGVFMQSFASFIFTTDVDVGLHVFFSLFPFVLLAKGLSDLGAATASELSEGLRFSEINNADLYFFPLQTVYLCLVANFCLYVILAWYCDNVRYIGRKPWFFLTPAYWLSWCGIVKKKKPETVSEESKYKVEMDQIDEDVQAETKLVNDGNFGDDTPVVIKNLRKTYKSYSCGCIVDKKRAFRAVKGIDLVMKQGELFCLLGHNGAGKSTTIGMMTGLFPCTGGDATVFGYSITNDMNEIRKTMGVCPQHDILWKQLTGKEHLELFANLRGIKKKDIAKEVAARLEDVDLTSSKDEPAGSYSGGMQRRLSVAIALIGDPAIVYLDEPTTGMDPVSRRKVWNLIEKVKRGRVILLTTHSMEEADILGDKIAIMKDGRLATIGTSIRLKNRFGTGYGISILGNSPKDVPNIRKFVTDQFRNAADPIVIEDEDAKATLGIFQFEVPRSESKNLPSFFKKLEKNKKSIGVKDFQVSLATLEEVFLQIAHQEDVKEVRKQKEKKSRKGLIIGLSITAALIVLIAIGLIAFFLTRPPPPPPVTARDIPASPPSYLAFGSLNPSLFLHPPLVSEVSDDRATIRLRTTNVSAVDLYVVYSLNSSRWSTPTTFFNLNTTLLPNGNSILAYSLNGLRPDTYYSIYASVAGDSSSRSQVTQFRTPFPTDNPRKYRFGVSSGFGKTNRPYRTLNSASSSSLDFFLLLGDTIYDSFASSSSVTEDLYEDFFAQTGIQNLTKSTSIYALMGLQEIGAPTFPLSLNPSLSPLISSKADAFRTSFGLPSSPSPMYRRIQWGSALDLFILDMRRDAASNVSGTGVNQIISSAQMNWLKTSLSSSSATLKLIVAHQPFSDFSFERSLSSIVSSSSWMWAPQQRTELLNHISTIPGVLFLSGGVEFGLFRVNLTLNSTSGYFGSNAFEVVSGPSGSQINSAVRMSSALAQAPQSYRVLIDAWSWSLFEGDPITGDLTISFMNDEGRVLRSQAVNLFKSDLGIQLGSTAAQFFR